VQVTRDQLAALHGLVTGFALSVALGLWAALKYV
jgi:hypothetical protein